MTAPTTRLADQLRRFGAGVAAGRGEDEEEEDERQREAVVEPGLEVERVADGARDQPRGDHRRGDDRVGGREHRAEQEGLGPAEGGEERLGGEREERHRDRHRDHQRPRHRAPVAPQQLALDEHPVGEEGEDQRQLDQLDDRPVAWHRRGRRRSRRARCRARPRGPRRRERCLGSARERGDDGEQSAEEQDRFAEPDVHRPGPPTPSRPRSTSSSATWTALVAAPLRRLSETIQRSIARSLPGSRRIRPTKTSSRPAASIASG